MARLLGDERGRVPPPVEDDSESAWAEYDACCNALDARLSRPVTRPLMSGFRASARVRDSQLASELAQSPAPPRRLTVVAPQPIRILVTVDEVMRLARVNDRVCPQLAPWRLLYQLLPVDATCAERAPYPIDRLRWADTPDLHKRLRLREQVEWAAAHGGLERVHAMLLQLAEAQWHHHAPVEWPTLPSVE